MKVAICLLGFVLCLGLMPLTQARESAPSSNGQGIITEFSIENRMMLINDKEYHLTDKMQVVNKENIAAGEMILKNGQSVEYWLDQSGKINKHLEKGKESLPSIKRIRVLSDVKMNY